MKKTLLVMSLGFLAGALFCVKQVSASCMGPFCWDDTGASVDGRQIDGDGMGIPVMTLAALKLNTPRAANKLVICSTCIQTNLCISTGAATPYAYSAVSTTMTVRNGGQCL